MNHKLITIEDDLLLAEDLRLKLLSLGYEVLGNATTAEEAVQLVTTFFPDLIIADIRISGDKDGIDAVTEIYKTYLCPVIYLTASSESVTVKKALATHPAAFLLKPFKISEFAINIDLAIDKFRKNMTFESTNRLVTDSIFLPQDFLYHRVRKKDIQYVEADGAYVRVYTKNKTFYITINLKSFDRQLNDRSFFRISRKHLVNTEYISRINGNTLYLDIHGKEHMLTIGRDQRHEILNRFVTVKTRN